MSRQFYIIWIACLAFPVLAWIISEFVIVEVRMHSSKFSSYTSLRRGTFVVQGEFMVKTDMTFGQSGHRIIFNREALLNPYITGLRSWWIYYYHRTYSGGVQHVHHLRIPLWLPLLTILTAGAIPWAIHYRKRRRAGT